MQEKQIVIPTYFTCLCTNNNCYVLVVHFYFLIQTTLVMGSFAKKWQQWCLYHTVAMLPGYLMSRGWACLTYGFHCFIQSQLLPLLVNMWK